MALRIGLTGGIASGKSTVCRIFSTYSVPIIDADVIARNLVEPGQKALLEIVNTFGSKVLLHSGQLDRRMLRSIVFSDLEAKRQLEAILHPKIEKELQHQSSLVNSSYCIIAIPLLIEAGLQNSVDRILVIDIDSTTQLKRLCERDKLSREEALNIINTQCNREERLSYADDVIINNTDIDQLNARIKQLNQTYTRLWENAKIGNSS